MKRLLISLVLLAVWSGALAFDPLASEARLAALPPPGQVPLDAELVGGPECPAQGFVGGGPISLAEVVKRALCHDPRTRQAWAESRLQAARLGLARAAYLPTLNATLSRARTGQTIGQGGSTARNDGATRIAQLELGWNLFDFGQREANVESARQTLQAAVASQDLGVQTVFLDAANAYFALLAAQGELAVNTLRRSPAERCPGSRPYRDCQFRCDRVFFLFIRSMRGPTQAYGGGEAVCERGPSRRRRK